MVARRIFVVLALVSILVAFAVPAFATSGIPPSDELFGGVRRSMLPFERVVCNSGVYEWPFRQSVAGSPSVTFEFNDGLIRGDVSCSLANEQIVGSISFPFDDYFTLHASGFMYDAGAEYEFRILSALNQDGDNVAEFGVVDISFTLWTIGKQGQFDTYRAIPHSYEGSFVVDQYLGVTLGKFFAQAVSTLEDNGKCFITDLYVYVPFDKVGIDTPIFTVISDSTVNASLDPATWVANQRLTHTTISGNPAYFDATSWLASAVGGFLSFEIAPGFSIDNIFWMILVVLCVLWFLTLIL